jgi:hypothetical protein
VGDVAIAPILRERYIDLGVRNVLVLKATPRQLAGSLDVLNDVAEVRRAKQSAGLFVDSPAQEQAHQVDDVRRRTTLPPAAAPAVCILDTGVTRAHPLLDGVIAPEDATAVDISWGPHDDGGGAANAGHGTEMAGLAAYGDLVPVLTANMPVQLRHRVESVKILPPTGSNDPELYGAVTAQAVARPEITAPARSRVFSMAVTATDARDRGQPSSWSAAIDALSAGRAFDPATNGLQYVGEAEQGMKRLFVISAGNVATDLLQRTHLDRSDLESVHDPAQAWNALTVGACTEKAVITDPTRHDWAPVAHGGDLSPWSTTSVMFEEPWPIKPDLVFEGGNLAHRNDELDFPLPDLCLLSTYYKPAEKPFVLSFATSAAAVQVARIAALVQAEYPSLWPEAIRAILVHAARWTSAMDAQLRGAGGKRARARLVRRYGFGVPSPERALHSANDALTLISQSVLHPFHEGKMREMHFHELPWPRDVLQGLGATPVRLRVTLSYFVEPNPGRRGWKRRHRYASHGLRFDVKSPTESIAEFRKSLNARALAEEEDRPETSTSSSDWYLGEHARNRGSLHSDLWVGTAADLAERGVIGVYPVSGWWKDQPKRDRSAIGARYALVVGIETDAENVDIWTPVATAIEVPVEEIVIAR